MSCTFLSSVFFVEADGSDISFMPVHKCDDFLRHRAMVKMSRPVGITPVTSMINVTNHAVSEPRSSPCHSLTRPHRPYISAPTLHLPPLSRVSWSMGLSLVSVAETSRVGWSTSHVGQRRLRRGGFHRSMVRACVARPFNSRP